MKNIYFYSVLLAIPIIAFMMLSNSGGKTGQFSGSPGDGSATCSTCHSGGSFDAVATITSNIPASGFVYGDTYEITVSVTSTSSKHGFQLTAEDASNAKVGTYVAGTGNQIVNGGTHMTHTQAGNQQDSWTFDWTAPTSAEGGEITFYVAVNATDNNSSTSGDEVVTTSITYSQSNLGLAEEETIPLNIFPNPSSDYITLDYDQSSLNDVTMTITNYNGQVVMQTNNVSKKINIKDLNTGIYIVNLVSDTKTVYCRFIKE